MADGKTFDELLFEGTMIALRSLTFEQLCEHWIFLRDMDLPEDIAKFPKMMLSLAIKEKELQRMIN